MKRVLLWLPKAVWVLGCLGLAATVLGGSLARWVPGAEPLSNVRTHLSLGLLVGSLGMGLWLWKRWRSGWGILVGFLLALGAWGAGPYLRLLLPPADRLGDGEHGPVLAVGAVNLLFGIGHPEPVFAWMDGEGLDLVGFVEMKESPRSKLRWPRLLESWRGTYPHQVLEIHEYYGMAILSKIPIEKVGVVHGPGGHGIESTRPLSLRARLRWDGRDLDVLLVHPPHPDRTWRQDIRVDFFQNLVTELRRDRSSWDQSDGGRPGGSGLLVLGDFNANEGSPFFRDVRSQGELVGFPAGVGSHAHLGTPQGWQEQIVALGGFGSHPSAGAWGVVPGGGALRALRPPPRAR